MFSNLDESMIFVCMGIVTLTNKGKEFIVHKKRKSTYTKWNKKIAYKALYSYQTDSILFKATDLEDGKKIFSVIT